MNWIKQIKEDENKALKLLYKTFRDDIIQWLGKNYGLEYEVSTDIFQYAVVLFYDKVIQNKVSEEGGKVKTYLYGICKNKALTHIRSKKKENKFIQSFSDIYQDSLKNKGEELEKQLEQTNLIDNVLTKIGNPCKNILVLFYYKNMDLTEITNILGYKNTNTTKNQKYKCIKRLQSMIFDIN